MSLSTKSTLQHTSLAIGALLALWGCLAVAPSPAAQCATDNDCYVKFGGGFTCQAGGCGVATEAEQTRRVVTTLEDCRATQECVASLGEGWLCRRDRDDPQKKGKCQQLTPTSECRVYGDYKNDQAILLGSVLPGKDSPALASATRSGLERAVADWEVAIRQLQATNVGADAVAPPRPFAVVACTEDVPRNDLRNLFLNSGVPLIIGPMVLREGTEQLSTELTTAKLLLLSPTSVTTPKEGSNAATYFFRAGGAETDLVTAISGLAVKPTVIVRRAGSYEKVATALGLTEQTYDTPDAFLYSLAPSANVLVLGDGDVTTILTKLPVTIGDVYVLPTAIPDVTAKLVAGIPLPSKLSSLRPARSAAIPLPPFAATAYGDAEAYDALYVALAGLAAVGDAKSPEAVKEEELRTAILRVSDPAAATTFPAVAASIKLLVKELRVGPADMKIRLDGASGPLTIVAASQSTTRSFVQCKLTSGGCT